MQDVPTADRVAGDRCHHRLGQAADLDLQVQHVEATDPVAGYLVVAEVAVVAADLLVASGTERVRSRSRQDDGAHRDVVARALERVGELEERLGAKRVAPLRSVDGDARDPLGNLVDDVVELTTLLPLGQGPRAELVDGVNGRTFDNGL